MKKEKQQLSRKTNNREEKKTTQLNSDTSKKIEEYLLKCPSIASYDVIC
jgi:hypothetical protein